ncbi:MAG: zinc ribbon domain-containing protein [Candidatus Nomurabacteria bacterium]|nr:zinc ribbon domain-containing protein [Candidatus Nomurabacteria bacterium]
MKTCKNYQSPYNDSLNRSRLQAIRRGKSVYRSLKHDYLFRKLIRCRGCEKRLIGELKKGHIYYRCHTKDCPTKTLREDRIESYFKNYLSYTGLNPKEELMLDEALSFLESNWLDTQRNMLQSIDLHVTNIEQRIARLTDAYLDAVLGKDAFEAKNKGLMFEKRELLEKKENLSQGKNKIFDKTKKYLELLKGLKNTYDSANYHEKREIIEHVTSNLEAEGRKLIISTKTPFTEFVFSRCGPVCEPNRGRDRTCNRQFVYPDEVTILYNNKPFSKEQIDQLLDMLYKAATEEVEKEKNDV